MSTFAENAQTIKYDIDALAERADYKVRRLEGDLRAVMVTHEQLEADLHAARQEIDRLCRLLDPEGTP